MEFYLYVFISVYVILLCCYFYTRIGTNFLFRAVNKIVLSSMFLLFALLHFLYNYNIMSVQGIAMVGVIFAFLGDIFLIWSFNKGSNFFMVGNIIFIVYELALMKLLNISFTDVWWYLILFIILYSILLMVTFRKWIDFKDKKYPVLIYMFTITTHGTLGIVLLYLSDLTKITLLGLGLALFMASDYFLILNRYKYNKNIFQWSNSMTYFIGLLLVALSFMFVL